MATIRIGVTIAGPSLATLGGLAVRGERDGMGGISAAVIAFPAAPVAV
jgi:hypothetical protein